MVDSPDWPLIIGAIFGGVTAVITAIGGILWKKNNKAVPPAPPAERTLPEVWKLVDKLQEERTRAGTLLVESEERYTKRMDESEARCIQRIEKLEATVMRLEIELREAYKK